MTHYWDEVRKDWIPVATATADRRIHNVGEAHEEALLDAVYRDWPSSEDMLAHYSAALDEIWRLRAALAYEAREIEEHLRLATFPKSRRARAEEQIVRMRIAMRAGAEVAYSERIPSGTAQGLLRAFGASPTLTRSQWEESRG